MNLAETYQGWILAFTTHVLIPFSTTVGHATNEKLKAKVKAIHEESRGWAFRSLSFALLFWFNQDMHSNKILK